MDAAFAQRPMMLIAGLMGLGLFAGCGRPGVAVQPGTFLTIFSAETPVTITCVRHQERMLMPVNINDRACHLLLDTGANGLVIHTNALDKLGLTRAEGKFVYASGAFSAGWIETIERFTIDIPDIATITCTHALIGAPPVVGETPLYMGVLGIDVLRPLGAVIDTSGGTVTFPRQFGREF